MKKKANRISTTEDQAEMVKMASIGEALAFSALYYITSCGCDPALVDFYMELQAAWSDWAHLCMETPLDQDKGGENWYTEGGHLRARHHFAFVAIGLNNALVDPEDKEKTVDIWLQAFRTALDLMNASGIYPVQKFMY